MSDVLRAFTTALLVIRPISPWMPARGTGGSWWRCTGEIRSPADGFDLPRPIASITMLLELLCASLLLQEAAPQEPDEPEFVSLVPS